MNAVTKRLLSDAIAAGDRAHAEGRQLNDDERNLVRKADEAVRDERLDERLDAKVHNLGRQVFGDAGDPDGRAIHGDPIRGLLASSEFKSYRASRGEPRSVAVEVEFKTPQDITSSTAANAGDFRQTLRPGVVMPFGGTTNVASLFSQDTMDGSSVSWVFSTDADAGADLVDIGDQKPPGSGTIDIDQVFARKIATTYTVPDDSLDDLPTLEQALRKHMVSGPGGVLPKLENQLINGSGTGTPAELVGVLSLSPATVTAGSNLAQDIVLAALDLETESGFAADAAIVNPLDAANLYFQESSSGFPLEGAPGFFSQSDLGIRVVRSRECPPGTVIVGAFKASTLYTRQSLQFAISNQGLGLFDYNLTLLRAEGRWAVAHPYAGATYRKITSFS